MYKTTSILLFLATFSLLTTFVQADTSADRATLLTGLTEITAPSALPGPVAAFGNQSFVFYTARAGETRLPLFAAAHYGKGRVVVGGHEGFINEPALMANLFTWCGRDVAKKRVFTTERDFTGPLGKSGWTPIYLDLKSPSRITDSNAILVLNQSSLDGKPKVIHQIQSWVQDGGGLIVLGPAWGWLETHPGKDLSTDHSGNQLVKPMGLAFCDGNLEADDDSGHYLLVSDSFPLAHAGNALKRLQSLVEPNAAPDDKPDPQITATLTSLLTALPTDDQSFAYSIEKLCREKAGEVIPTSKNPVTVSMPFARLKLALEARQWRRLPTSHVQASAAASSFPGVVPASAPRITRTLSFKPGQPGWQGTGLYAAPGQVVRVRIPQEEIAAGLSIRIGEHTDTLWHLNSWERSPDISASFPLNSETTKAVNPFGGTIFLEIPENCKLAKLECTIENGIAAPRFVLGKTSLTEWRKTLRQAPAPWAELEGKLIAISVPSSAVRQLDDPLALMTYWDEVAEHCYELYSAPKRLRPERYCVDRQISAGYMHSGYPIMTGEDVANRFCDLKLLRGHNGNPVWGFYHELGHNFQEPEWTWDAFGEVTNNLFSLYGTEQLNGDMSGAHPAMQPAERDKRIQLVAAKPGAEHYYEKDPWYPLTMFYLLRQEFGWKPFTQFFAEFRTLPASDRPVTEQQKHDQFLTRFSRLTGHNLTTYLSAWGVSLSDEAKQTVSTLPEWMPKNWPKQQ